MNDLYRLRDQLEFIKHLVADQDVINYKLASPRYQTDRQKLRLAQIESEKNLMVQLREASKILDANIPREIEL